VVAVFAMIAVVVVRSVRSKQAANHSGNSVPNRQTGRGLEVRCPCQDGRWEEEGGGLTLHSVNSGC
jgi:hypothetical protein